MLMLVCTSIWVVPSHAGVVDDVLNAAVSRDESLSVAILFAPPCKACAPKLCELLKRECGLFPPINVLPPTRTQTVLMVVDMPGYAPE